MQVINGKVTGSVKAVDGFNALLQLIVPLILLYSTLKLRIAYFPLPG